MNCPILNAAGRSGVARVPASPPVGTLLRLLTLLLFVLISLPNGTADAWDVVTHRGRGHVTLEQMAGFYGFEAPVEEGREIVLRTRGVELRFASGAKAVTINRLRFHLSYPIVTHRGRPVISVFDVTHLIDPVLRAPRVEESRKLRTVVIDPAHGGEESGVISRSGNESDLMLALALALRSDLEARGYTVRLTREEDRTLGPAGRIALANRTEDEAVFVSLHANRSDDASTHGVETYTLAPAGTPATYDPADTKPDLAFYLGNLHETENTMLATALHGALVVQCGARDLGIKRARFQELRGVRMPGVVLRVGHLGHKTEGAKLATESYRAAMSRALGDGIDRYAAYLEAGGRPAASDRLLRIAGIDVKTTPRESSAEGSAEEHKAIRLQLQAPNPDAPVDPSRVDIEVYVIDLVDDEYLEPAAVDPPQVSWLSVLPDWNAHPVEELQVLYRRPPAAAGERRRFFGYAVRILYEGHLQDTVASPRALDRCLYQFYALPSQ